MTARIAAALLALTLASALPALAQGGTPDLRAEIGEVDQAWQKAYNAGDATALTALYASDAKVMAPGAEPASGSAAIQKLFAANMPKGAKFTLTTADVVGFGDYALTTGSWVANGADGKHLDHGTYMTLYKKVDKGWKLYRDTWNSSMKQ
jgi:uncharacterized protein (TIGR02246 family)